MNVLMGIYLRNQQQLLRNRGNRICLHLLHKVL